MKPPGTGRGVMLDIWGFQGLFFHGLRRCKHRPVLAGIRYGDRPLVSALIVAPADTEMDTSFRVLDAISRRPLRFPARSGAVSMADGGERDKTIET